MAPGTRRANRGAYTDHDDFEGLPVRQWRQEWADAAPTVQAEPTRKDDIWSLELRWGMPRDTGLLASHSQELLRAARSGRLYKRPSPTEEEDTEAEAADKPEKKEDDTATNGFQVKVWKQITRNTDDSTISHLAKRRKGVITISSKTVSAQPSGATVTRATVRRTDAAGNPYTQEITLQEGQAVDGEIISTTVVPLAAVNEQAQPTPPRNRRPPPPKKNKKLGGPGRGRKKKMVPLPAPVPSQEGTVQGEGAAAMPKPEPTEGDNVLKQEREDSNNPDSEMADNDDEEGDDDGDDGDEGEGEEGDDNTEDQDQEMTDASPSIVQPSADTTSEMTGIESPLASKSEAPPNPLLAPPPNPSLSISSPKIEGSPLKNVILPSPTEPSPIEPPAGATSTQPEDARTPEATTGPSPAAAGPPAAESDAPAEQSVVKSPERERTPVLGMDITITDAATFIPPHDQVGDIKSPEPEARSLEVKSPEIKPPGIQSPEEKSPQVKSPAAKSLEVKSPAPSPAAPGEETAATLVVELTEEPQPSVEAEVTPQVEENLTVPPAATAEVAEDVKELSSAAPAPADSPEKPKEEDVEPLNSQVKEEAISANPSTEPAADSAVVVSPSAPAAEKAPPSDPQPRSPSPAAAEEGPDLLAGLENALGQEHDESQTGQPAAEAVNIADETPATEVKEEAVAEVKEETKDDIPKPEDAPPQKDSGSPPASATEPADTGSV